MKLRKKKVLILGIGGGGDILGTLLLACRLGNNSNDVTIGGLSWKRKVHDPEARPIKIEEFENIKKFNSTIGYVDKDTITKYGIKHIEADLKNVVDYPIVTIGINSSIKTTYNNIKNFIKKEIFDIVIGIDVGGDVLLNGNEKTIRSPICDAVMLVVLSKINNSYLGVIGLGGDGEIPLKTFSNRFNLIKMNKGFHKCYSFDDKEYIFLEKIIKNAKTESSRPIVEMSKTCSSSDRKKLVRDINNCEEIDEILEIMKINKVSLRNGSRRGELSCLTPLLICI